MKKLLFIVSTFLSLAVFGNDDKATTNAHLQSVTVYRSGAEMIHTATATLKQGSNELVIEQLSNAIDVNSIQVKVNDAITILGTEFSNNYLSPTAKTPRIKLLEDSLEGINKSINKIDLGVANNADLQQVLKANREIKGTQTGVSVAELIKLMDYYKLKLNELQTELTQLQEKRIKLQEIADKLQGQLDEEQQKNTSKSGRLILQLVVTEAGKYTFDISYIATNANWSPFYDLRVDDLKNPMKLIYKANISQSTGIDWKQVKLSLSTATPGQWGKAPELNPWFLQYKTYYGSFDNALAGRVAGVQLADASANDEVVVRAYGVTKKSMKPNRLEDHIAVTDNTLNVTFDIDIPYDIPTNGKEQTAVLKTYQVPASFKHFAIPKLDKDAYILAEVSDWEKLNLLPGTANVILEGTYTGKTFIDPNATQDTLNLTLGKDKRVVVKRDKLVDYSSVKFLGSNKVQKFTYEITIKNNKRETINFNLKDQFPLTTTKEIEVELVDAGGAAINSDLGLLNWQLPIAANESKKVRFTYTIKYPKDKVLNLN